MENQQESEESKQKPPSRPAAAGSKLVLTRENLEFGPLSVSCKQLVPKRHKHRVRVSFTPTSPNLSKAQRAGNSRNLAVEASTEKKTSLCFRKVSRLKFTDLTNQSPLNLTLMLTCMDKALVNLSFSRESKATKIDLTTFRQK